LFAARRDRSLASFAPGATPPTAAPSRRHRRPADARPPTRRRAAIHRSRACGCAPASATIPRRQAGHAGLEPIGRTNGPVACTQARRRRCAYRFRMLRAL